MRSIIKLFEDGNVCVTGLRGRGKDMLFANVVARRKKPYISNINYKCGCIFHPLNLSSLDPRNNYTNFITGRVRSYLFPYDDGTDVYISDVGVYFPSQYCGELNRDYKSLPVYMALSRQLSANNVHINVQNLNRAWDKLREQSDSYIYCRWCKVLFGLFVIQKVTIYEKYESCLARMEEPKLSVPLCNRVARTNAKMYLDQFRNAHGRIKSRVLFYINRSDYDTRHFRALLAGGTDEA